jgi:hypothetical protein
MTMTRIIIPLQVTVVAFVFLLLPGAPARCEKNAAVPKTALNRELQQELLRRVKEDQQGRTELIDWMKSRKVQDPAQAKREEFPAAQKLRAIDRANTQRLKEIVARYGWPGNSLVGKEGANAAWLLVQHADKDRPFQKECLRLMEQAAAKGEVSKTNLAYLTDRVLVGKQQRYGTQIREVNGHFKPEPIEDEGNVDKRRAEVGLEPLATYLEQIQKVYGPAAPKK